MNTSDFLPFSMCNCDMVFMEIESNRILGFSILENYS